MLTPLPLRKLRAEMALKALSVTDVHRLTGIPLAAVSQILGGHLVDPTRLAKIRSAIRKAPMPEEVAAQ
jgi:hypothetical protein